jgi:hypothetical protein
MRSGLADKVPGTPADVPLGQNTGPFEASLEVKDRPRLACSTEKVSHDKAASGSKPNGTQQAGESQTNHLRRL